MMNAGAPEAPAPGPQGPTEQKQAAAVDLFDDARFGRGSLPARENTPGREDAIRRRLRELSAREK
jgi:hypothetical protein